ncbi:MAG: hypothetical protein ACI9XC_001196 [Gammaproteobacteria bacterium]|jgi:hypothetical protein
MKIQSTPFLLTIVFALMTGFYFLPAQAAIKCWKNNEGVRECGNRVPPEFAQQGHEELSNSGMVVNQQGRVKTKEELEQAAKELEILAEQKRQQEQQARMDKILLATFSSVSEIEAARDGKLNVIQASITLVGKQSETIQLDLDKRILAAAEAERSGSTPNEALLNDIASLERQINVKKQYASEKQDEIDETTKEYGTNIERFKSLKGLK